ncbi:MAG: 5-formyltetrahydrofolate cyclo-ligase [Desulfuromonadaceae bacterium]|nr:5-formyltetrahydrofolate cyclo-ligase [Desulfuromonadaceae bacterium]MDD2847729.1 5-formyltetrahydrofolate cyclo-ligase [Desulfuromonadaceae bacterium]MDD4131025.1 5-formyltetrahydrofolate cyclo-ligase [Desulfuromonadaceae bacterium]
MPKRSLRTQLLAQRRALAPDVWGASSRAAQLNLLSLDEYVQAECVALYASAHNETDTALILATAFEAGKRVLYPAVCGHQMVFRRVERVEALQKGAFGILEPCPTGIDHQADEADLIVVPGVAFDLSGHRIGYGKGFYDRFLHHPDCRAHLVGLCHDFQLVENLIPADSHDIPMEIIITDKRIIRLKK